MKRCNVQKFTVQVQKYLADLAAAGRAESTISECGCRLRYFREYLRARGKEEDIRKIDCRLLKEYKSFLLAKNEWSFNHRLEVLHTVLNFFHHLSNEGVLLIDPAATIKLPRMSRKRLPTYLSKEEVEKLLDLTDPETPEGLRDREVLETFYSTGIRSGEAASLELSDIDFERGLATVRQGKGKKDRVVPIGKAALHYIERYIREVRGPGEHPALFRNMWKAQPLCADALRAILKRACKRAGIGKRVYPHLLRHSFAVHLLEGGAGIRHIAAMLGHEHLATTQIYTQVVPMQLKRVHQAAHPAADSKNLPSDIKLQKLYRKPSLSSFSR